MAANTNSTSTGAAPGNCSGKREVPLSSGRREESFKKIENICIGSYKERMEALVQQGYFTFVDIVKYHDQYSKKILEALDASMVTTVKDEEERKELHCHLQKCLSTQLSVYVHKNKLKVESEMSKAKDATEEGVRMFRNVFQTRLRKFLEAQHEDGVTPEGAVERMGHKSKKYTLKKMAKEGKTCNESEVGFKIDELLAELRPGAIKELTEFLGKSESRKTAGSSLTQEKSSVDPVEDQGSDRSSKSVVENHRTEVVEVKPVKAQDSPSIKKKSAEDNANPVAVPDNTSRIISSCEIKLKVAEDTETADVDNPLVNPMPKEIKVPLSNHRPPPENQPKRMSDTPAGTPSVPRRAKSAAPPPPKLTQDLPKRDSISSIPETKSELEVINGGPSHPRVHALTEKPSPPPLTRSDSFQGSLKDRVKNRLHMGGVAHALHKFGKNLKPQENNLFNRMSWRESKVATSPCPSSSDPSTTKRLKDLNGFAAQLPQEISVSQTRIKCTSPRSADTLAILISFSKVYVSLSSGGAESPFSLTFSPNLQFQYREEGQGIRPTHFNVIELIRTAMKPYVSLGSDKVSVEDVISEYLKLLVQCIYGEAATVTRPVIIYPGSYSIFQKRRLKIAATLAGFQEPQLLSFHSIAAASLAAQVKNPETVLIVHLSPSSFDAVVARVSGQKAEILSFAEPQDLPNPSIQAVVFKSNHEKLCNESIKGNGIIDTKVIEDSAKDYQTILQKSIEASGAKQIHATYFIFESSHQRQLKKHLKPHLPSACELQGVKEILEESLFQQLNITKVLGLPLVDVFPRNLYLATHFPIQLKSYPDPSNPLKVQEKNGKYTVKGTKKEFSLSNSVPKIAIFESCNDPETYQCISDSTQAHSLSFLESSDGIYRIEVKDRFANAVLFQNSTFPYWSQLKLGV